MIFLDYNNYIRARDAAWRCLIDCGISFLPTRLSAICHHYNVDIIKNSDLSDREVRLSQGQRGKLISSEGKCYIIVDDSETYQAQRYTIAHELGHLIIPTSDEYEAERFAIGILAPACVLWGCNIHSAEDIAMICNISQVSAKIRSERMETLYKRNRFLISPLERQVFNNFSEFIKSISSEKH